MATLSSEIVFQPSHLHLVAQTESTQTQLRLSADKWPLLYLVDYIMNNHHFYITDALPRITGLLEKVVTEYGLVYPQLQEIHQMFHSLAMHLITQMRKEELILFPYIQVLTKSTAADSSGCGAESIKHLLQELEEEHAIIEQTLADIRRLTQNYAVPAHVCNSYRLLFEWLEKFEKDIYEHEYLENNILFPKAIALEQVVHSRI